MTIIHMQIPLSSTTGLKTVEHLTVMDILTTTPLKHVCLLITPLLIMVVQYTIPEI